MGLERKPRPKARPGDDVDRGVVARMLAYLFALGALLMLATLTLPDSADRETQELVGVAAISILVAFTLIAAYDRTPVWVLKSTPFVGTLLAGLVVYYSDQANSAAYAMYLAWVLVAASLFLDPRLILIHGILAIAVYAAVMVANDYPDSILAVRVAMTTGTVLATALVVGALGRHVRGVMGQLHSAAQTDPLTGLSNRRALDDAFARELARAERAGTPLGVVILDLDGFKRFNDERGHQEGDRALERLSIALAEKTRAGDVLARIGGEEFALLVPDCDASAALVLAERLRRAVEVEFGGDGSLTASCGVASFPAHGESSAALIAAADGALYEAKRLGRNRVVPATVRPSLQVVEAAE